MLADQISAATAWEALGRRNALRAPTRPATAALLCPTRRDGRGWALVWLDEPSPQRGCSGIRSRPLLCTNHARPRLSMHPHGRVTCVLTVLTALPVSTVPTGPWTFVECPSDCLGNRENWPSSM